VLKSSEIEGEFLNRDQVRSSVAHRLGIAIESATPSDRNIDGVVEMVLDATENYRHPLTMERLWAWHAALFPTGYSGLLKITVGGWRTDAIGPMQVVTRRAVIDKVHFEAPGAARIVGEMTAFLAWFNADDDKIDPVIKAGIAHLWFVTIHPFEDGNGRIGRAIADMALARSEDAHQRFYSMSAQIRRERDDYYDFLEDTQKGDLDITAHLDWFLGCLDRALTGAETALADILRKARFRENFSDADLNERQRRMINRLLDGFVGKMTSSKWAKIAKCSQDTALRDIDALVRLGLLTKDPGGGRSTSYSLVDLG
jgi:Fic family protein